MPILNTSQKESLGANNFTFDGFYNAIIYIGLKKIDTRLAAKDPKLTKFYVDLHEKIPLQK